MTGELLEGTRQSTDFDTLDDSACRCLGSMLFKAPFVYYIIYHLIMEARSF